VSVSQLSPSGSFVDLRRVRVRRIEAWERERWDALMARHHYLGLRALVGESVRHVGELEGRWLALLGWCTAALKCSARDRWIGWPPWLQWRRLHGIANNARFLILPGVAVPNLASRVLGLSVRRLSEDFEQLYGHRIVLAETFVDPRRFAGTCYRAAGWQELGSTRGFARQAGQWRHHGQSKRVWVRVLDPRGLARLADPATPNDLDKEGKMVVSPLTNQQAETLWESLLQLPDPRQRRGRRHSKMSVLAVAICAVMGGARGLTAIGEAALRLPQRLLKRLGCRLDRRTGRYQAPSESTIRRFLQSVDPEAVERVLGGWLRSVEAAAQTVVALDGKSLRGARRPDGTRVHILGVFATAAGVTWAQHEVPAGSNEIAEARAVLEPLPLQGKVVTADAMHTQRELARFLVEDKQADYALTVKDNQPTLKRDIQTCFDDPAFFP